MHVELIAHNPDAQRLVASAGKLCHEPDDHSFEMMYSTLSDEVIDRIIKMLIAKGHESVLEHSSYTFIVEGVSRALTHQLVRHRIGFSYSQQSMRYVKMDNPSYVIPKSIPDDKIVEYTKHMDNLWIYYKELMNNGMKPEDARFVLPHSTTTKIVITANARSLRNFFKQRIHPHAQWEIREMARLMFNLVVKVHPLLFQDLLGDIFEDE